jgi:DNA-binding SARP family transcriptional activator
MRELQVRLLGSIGAVCGGRPVDLRGPRQQRLLGVLALHPGRRVDATDIIDAVWPQRWSPPDARAVLYTYVSRLRRSLGERAAIDMVTGGYRLSIDRDCIDAQRFESAMSRAGHPAASVNDRIEWYRVGMGEYRGRALSGFGHEPWAQADAARLNELYEFGVDESAALAIDVGAHDEAIIVLVAAVADQPLRERRVGLLMLAFHRSGRRAEALRVFQSHRNRLADELGLDPGAAIVALERAILIDDVSRPRFVAPRQLSRTGHRRCVSISRRR